MTTDDTIRDETLPYNLREAAKILALSQGKIYEYEYLAGEEILHPNTKKNNWRCGWKTKKNKMIDDVTENQTKPLQTLNTDQQLKWIGDLFSKDFITTDAKDE